MLAEKIKITLAELSQRLAQNIIDSDDIALTENLKQYQLALEHLVAACPRHLTTLELTACLESYKADYAIMMAQLHAIRQSIGASVQATRKIRQYFTL